MKDLMSAKPPESANPAPQIIGASTMIFAYLIGMLCQCLVFKRHWGSMSISNQLSAFVFLLFYPMPSLLLIPFVFMRRHSLSQFPMAIVALFSMALFTLILLLLSSQLMFVG